MYRNKVQVQKIKLCKLDMRESLNITILERYRDKISVKSDR